MLVLGDVDNCRIASNSSATKINNLDLAEFFWRGRS